MGNGNSGIAENSRITEIIVIMLYLYSLIRYKRCTCIVRVMSGCFCSHSSMKLLWFVYIGIILFWMHNTAISAISTNSAVSSPP